MMELKNISLSSHQEIEHFEVTEPIMVLVCFFFFFNSVVLVGICLKQKEFHGCLPKGL